MSHEKRYKRFFLYVAISSLPLFQVINYWPYQCRSLRLFPSQGSAKIIQSRAFRIKWVSRSNKGNEMQKYKIER